MAPIRQRLTRVESRAQTRQHVLDAARQVFARSGFGGATIDAIAAEAGYTKGAVYSNFDSKEAIFLELLSVHMARELDQLGLLAEGGHDKDALDAWLTTMNSDADWSLLAIELQLHARRDTSFGAQYATLQSVHRNALARLIARLFAANAVEPPGPVEDIAAGMMAMAQGSALLRPPMTTGESDPAGRLIKLFLDALLNRSP